MKYQPPSYLRSGLVQSIYSNCLYGQSWNRWRQNVWWLRDYPPIPWQSCIFQGAEDVPLWGQWACPPQAKGTLIINYGITGKVANAWYAHTVAIKAYAQGWAVCLYDWRSHGKTAELSPVPCSDGWREGEDQVKIAQKLVELGCPPWVGLVGFSLGGQLALWGLRTATELNDSLIQTAVTLSPNLESWRSLNDLQTHRIGRWLDRRLTQELHEEVQHKSRLFPEIISPQALTRIHCIMDFDREMVIDYYGFKTVEEYYLKTSPLYFLKDLKRPYLIVYAADDPMFDPTLPPDLLEQTQNNPKATVLLTPQGGHLSHLAVPTPTEDQFWGLNRLLDFCETHVSCSLVQG